MKVERTEMKIDPEDFRVPEGKYDDHQKRRQDRLPRHEQTDNQEENRHDFLNDGIQGVGQDALKGYPALLDRGDNSRQARLGQHHAGG
jgi:hypothetical protein